MLLNDETASVYIRYLFLRKCVTSKNLPSYLKNLPFKNFRQVRKANFNFLEKRVIQNKTLKTTNLVKTYTKFLKFY